MHLLSMIIAAYLCLLAADAQACGHCQEKNRQDEARRTKVNRERQPARICGKTILARSSVNTVGNPCETSESFKLALTRAKARG